MLPIHKSSLVEYFKKDILFLDCQLLQSGKTNPDISSDNLTKEIIYNIKVYTSMDNTPSESLPYRSMITLLGLEEVTDKAAPSQNWFNLTYIAFLW